VAVTVTEAPRLTEDPLIVIALLVSDALPIFDSVFADPEIETPFSVVSVPPKESEKSTENQDHDIVIYPTKVKG
jgi:hypothetical protein